MSTSTQPPPPYTPATTGDYKYNILPSTTGTIDKVSDIICLAFWDAPLLRCFISERDDFPPQPQPTDPSSPITQTRRLAHFHPGISRVVESGAIVCESGDYSAVSIWEPPSFDAPDFSSVRKDWVSTSRDWTRQMKLARARYLGTPAQRAAAAVTSEAGQRIDEHSTLDLVPFWHLSFLARNFDPDVEVVRGAVSSVVGPFLEMARRDGRPAWLEATSEHAVDVYRHWGFRVVDTIVVGKGKFGKDGWPCEGGEGVSAWCMIFDDHLTGDNGN